MRRPLVIAIVLAALSLGYSSVLALTEATVRAPSWPEDITFEFGIYENGERQATAYYRILREELDGRAVYHFKYNGRNDAMSEATECWADAASLEPLRSTRKVVFSRGTYYQDIAYGDDVVRVRSRYEGEPAKEYEQPLPGTFYDYEELLWLIPQLDFGGDSQARFELYNSLHESRTTVLITREADTNIEVQGKSYPARVFSFNVGTTQYKYWLTMQDGMAVPARVDMAGTRFENLKLSPGKVTAFGE